MLGRAAAPAVASLVALVAVVGCGGRNGARRACTLAIETPPDEVGFEAEARVRARLACPEGVTPPGIVWEDGTRGAERVVRTPKIADALRPGERGGILAVSPAQGRIPVRARAGDATAEADVVVAHAQTGVPSVPIGIAVYVWGGPGGTIQRIVPAERGSQVVRDAKTGFEITIAAGDPETQPVDCQRSECHPTEFDSQAPTRHATVFDRAMAAPPRGHEVRCLLCHTTGGDPGIRGGFVDVAREIGFLPIPARAMAPDELPSVLRRLAGVTCVGCHGPARIPTREWRATVYGNGVCAQCHDLPPRYKTVQEWRASRMSRLTTFAHEAECAGCHTAQGFAVRLGVVRFAEVDARTAEPITCSACHDPHGPGSRNPHLLRRFDPAAGGSRALCAECHRADAGADPAKRLALRLAPMAPQSEMAPGDCIGCHRAHTFRAPQPVGADEQVAARFKVRIAEARAALRADLPRVRGCNRAARGAADVAVVRDRLALVDAAGNALGDCDDDGRFGEREDPMVSAAVAAALYARAYSLATVERDRSNGLHAPDRADMLLGESEKGIAAP